MKADRQDGRRTRSPVPSGGWLGLVLAGLWLSCALAARAVVFLPPADANHNTTPPTGALAGSGWQWVGSFGGFHGVPIGPKHFITAAHVGSSPPGTTPFVLDGISYTTVQSTKDPSTDLLIWEVSGTFPSWAPLYRSSNELGRGFVVYGRGDIRGDPANNAYGQLGGWSYGASDGRLRWGTNVVSEVDANYHYLIASFDAGAGADEVHLADGDSAGAVFIQDPVDGIWKLAGINYGVEAYFNNTTISPIPPTGTGFRAALFDKGGFWIGSVGAWQWILDTSLDKPSRFAASRISSRASWIDTVAPPTPSEPPIQVPALPPAGTLLLGGILVIWGCRALMRP